MRTRRAHGATRVAALGVFLFSACSSATDASSADLPIVFVESVDFQGERLVLMSADGGVRRTLLDLPDGIAVSPRWSPDGQQILFYHVHPGSKYPGPYTLSMVNADGSGFHPLMSADYLGPGDWSPDGTRLVAYGGITGLVLLRTDGSDPMPLPQTFTFSGGIGAFNSVSWSYDGNKILFNADPAITDGSTIPGTGVWSYNLSTGQAELLAGPGADARWSSDGRWSPDGKHVAYIETVGITSPSQLSAIHQITVINSDGSNPIHVTGQSSTVPDLTWSPNGQRLVFVGDCCDRSDLYSVAATGGRATNLTHESSGAYASYPDWRRAH